MVVINQYNEKIQFYVGTSWTSSVVFEQVNIIRLSDHF